MSASSRVDVIVARFAASIEHVAASRLAMLHGTERDLVRLAIAMAEHVLRRKVEVDPALLVSMAREALERLGGAPAVTIHLNPADFETISRLHPAAAIGGAVEVVADPNVHPGGCLARTTGGTIDAGIDAQFRESTRAMLGDEARSEGPRSRSPEGPSIMTNAATKPDAAAALAPYLTRLKRVETAPMVGHVVRVVGLLVESTGPAASVGESCEVRTRRGDALPVEVVGFRDGRLLCVPLGDTAGIRPGDPHRQRRPRPHGTAWRRRCSGG